MEKKGDTNFFTSQMIKACMKKVITVNLHQTIQVLVVLYVCPCMRVYIGACEYVCMYILSVYVECICGEWIDECTV